MRTHARFIALLLMIAISAQLAAGCRSKESAEPEVGEPYKIGALLSATGSSAAMGSLERDAAQLRVEQLNAEGGITGPDGKTHTIELIVYDTESDVNKTLLGAKKLIDQDKVLAIVGPNQSGAALAILDTVQGAGIPMLPMAIARELAEPIEERKWVFMVPPEDIIMLGVAADYLEGQGIQKVAFMNTTRAFGKIGREVFGELAMEKGITIVTTEEFESTDKDMSAQLTRIMGTDAEAVIVWDTPPSTGVIQKQASVLGLGIPIIQNVSAGIPLFVRLVGPEAMEGMLLVAARVTVFNELPDDDPMKPRLVEANAAIEEKYDTSVNLFHAFAWDAVDLLAEALKKVGDDPAAIRDELEKTQGFVGVSAILSFSPTDHLGCEKESMMMGQFRDGKFTVLEQ
jgi:branched-chain amino acid transport system substrate-binding protein